MLLVQLTVVIQPKLTAEYRPVLYLVIGKPFMPDSVSRALRVVPQALATLWAFLIALNMPLKAAPVIDCHHIILTECVVLFHPHHRVFSSRISYVMCDGIVSPKTFSILPEVISVLD
jgi:hypothetical protein